MSVPAIVRTNTAELYDAYVMKNYGRPPLTLVRGAGVTVWDDTGREYLDFTSGVAVAALGHCHPVWVEAIRRQAGELIHCSNLFRNPNQGELARRLVQQAGPGRVFFCNSGTEANEGLIKLARLHGVRKSGAEGKCIKIICAKNAFHGRTFGGMSATPQEKIQKGFRPLIPGFAFGELNNLQSYAELVDENTSAIFLETIQGEGGITPCTDEFLWGVRQLCDQHDLLLMLDEVQCGLGRTGTFYAFQHSGVRVDAIGMAKGLGGGYPMGAIWAAEKHAELFTPGSHGSTFGGTPLACAAALAVLDVIERENLLHKVTANGAAWKVELEKLVTEFPRQLRAVTGRGYMLGLLLHREPPPYITALREAGLLAPPAGTNTIRLLPPLIATKAHLERATAIIRSVLGRGKPILCAMRHFLKETDFSRAEVGEIFSLARHFKRHRGAHEKPLAGQTWAMIFAKSSTRTRVSFEVGIHELGGNPLFLNTNDIQIGRGETIADTAKVLSRFVHGLVVRTYAQDDLEGLAAHGGLPVVNALTDFLHPCQIYTDAFTAAERWAGSKGDLLASLSGRKVAFLGDTSFNMANSWILGAALFGMKVSLAGPAGSAPGREICELAAQAGGTFQFTHDPHEAVAGADLVYTDVWTSMGQENEAAERRRRLLPFQVNAKLFAAAEPDALFMHCLPAHAGEEVTQEVLDNPRCVIFDEAENRLHVQKAILALLARHRA